MSVGSAPDGVDVVLAMNGTVAAYATDGGNDLGLSVGDLMFRSVRIDVS
jgi:hypothetical protein